MTVCSGVSLFKYVFVDRVLYKLGQDLGATRNRLLHLSAVVDVCDTFSNSFFSLTSFTNVGSLHSHLARLLTHVLAAKAEVLAILWFLYRNIKLTDYFSMKQTLS